MGGGIHTRIESTRFTLRGNSGVHSRTSKSQNSISVNRCWWTWGREKERESERTKALDDSSTNDGIYDNLFRRGRRPIISLQTAGGRACVNIVLSDDAYKSHGFPRLLRISRDPRIILCSVFFSSYDFFTIYTMFAVYTIFIIESYLKKDTSRSREWTTVIF